jgi:anti-anti-sigma factor
MEIGDKKIGEVDVLYLFGRLDAYAANDIEKKMSAIADKSSVSLVVSMDKLEYISSSGLRVLLSSLKKARKQQEI